MSYFVLIIEDVPVFRADFVNAVTSANDMRLAGEADNLPEGPALLAQIKPDMLLVDIGSRIALIRRATEVLPHCDVMVVTYSEPKQHRLSCKSSSSIR